MMNTFEYNGMTLEIDPVNGAVRDIKGRVAKLPDGTYITSDMIPPELLQSQSEQKPRYSVDDFEPAVRSQFKYSKALAVREISEKILSRLPQIVTAPYRHKNKQLTKGSLTTALVNDCRLDFGDIFDNHVKTNPGLSATQLTTFFDNTWGQLHRRLKEDFETRLPEILGDEFDVSVVPLIRKALWTKADSRIKMSGVLQDIYSAVNEETRRFDSERLNFANRMNQCRKERHDKVFETEQRTMNPYPVLDAARKLLNDVHIYMVNPQPDWYPFDYRDVSCALALVTGRRMAEIHCTATFVNPDFEETPPAPKWYATVLPDHWCYVTGLAKNNQYTYEVGAIPILCDVYHVQSGMAYLGFAKPTRGRNAGIETFRCETPKDVNVRFSKYLPQRARENWIPNGLNRETFKYHDFRDIYLAVCLREFQPSKGREAEFIKGVLCDVSQQSADHYTTLLIDESL